MSSSSQSALGPPPPWDLSNYKTVREVAQRYEIEARKAFSQHWLVDADALETIVTAAELQRTDNVLEVGAGMGVLTAELGRRAGRVVAVEIERDVMPVLRKMTKIYQIVEIINADLMTINPAEVFGAAPYKLVANLPYSITGLTLRHFLEDPHPPELMVILIQKEVAERITAQPGEMSLLALSVQFYATPRIIAKVPAASFMPPPEVDSAIVALTSHPPAALPELGARMFALAKLCFSQRRKQLHNTLPGAMHLPAAQVQAWLEAAGIAPERRPQTLSLAEWLHLAELMPGK